ncbi:hypothetical protein JOC95_003941 [Bacillus tianshenii]|uniref:Uncharacterized protein n=1 Tax=Sutcliffiella tianshenii TaxID=1463404 RepID=A0ABS2P4Y8_9BACI|nr:hypothetical protein [Bacillus tianshenii]MBM7622031.1 hypothetical protein [Bacillus tianshenii]
MSSSYKNKSCCNKKDDCKDDHKKDHDQDCFCDKFITKFIGQEVKIFTKDGKYVSGLIAWFDKESGIVILVPKQRQCDDLAVDYICCKHIVRIRREAC